MATRSTAFSSPQYRFVCDLSEVVVDPPQCLKDKKDEIFTYIARNGFQIEDASFKILMRAAGTEAVDFDAQDNKASKNLRCSIRDCDKLQSHTAIAGTISGLLAYRPTIAEAKAVRHGLSREVPGVAAGLCVSQAKENRVGLSANGCLAPLGTSTLSLTVALSQPMTLQLGTCHSYECLSNRLEQAWAYGTEKENCHSGRNRGDR